MAVVARMYVAEVHSFAYNPDQRQIVLRAVSRGEENKSWAAATPSGEVNLHINNPDASAWFAERLGQDVLLTFQEAPKAGPTSY